MTNGDSRAMITEEGKKKAETELAHLKETKRKQVAEKISAAKEMGDLSENAEYTAAKEEQAFVEARIQELELLLKYADVVPAQPQQNSTVVVGSTVTIEHGSDTTRYTIVGLNEADPRQGKITNESPMGKALLGRQVGDEVVVATPSGERRLKIVAIG